VGLQPGSLIPQSCALAAGLHSQLLTSRWFEGGSIAGILVFAALNLSGVVLRYSNTERGQWVTFVTLTSGGLLAKWLLVNFLE